ncbi:MAG: hypothetical protein ABW217_05160 [Polyangiaceae bacterium]
MKRSTTAVFNLGTALREAGTKISNALRELKRQEDEASSWMQRFIAREIEERTSTRGAAYWDKVFPGLSPQARAEKRIGRMITRATVAGTLAAAGASSAEVLSIVSEGFGTALAVPIGLVSVGAEMMYITAIQIDLAFDLASIYDVPFAGDDVGEISTMLAMALGVDFVREPTRHDKPAMPGETKPWRVLRQMQRGDFSKRVSKAVVQQSVLRNVVPVAGVIVSAVWNQVVLRRFAREVHTAVRQRLAIRRAFRDVQLSDGAEARVVLDGAWLLATCDGELDHQEALALSTLIDSLHLPGRIAVEDASFTDDELGWFDRVAALDASSRAVLIDVLALIASADGELTIPERRFLKRVARAIQIPIDLAAIERMVERMRDGEAPREQSVVPALNPALAPA